MILAEHPHATRPGNVGRTRLRRSLAELSRYTSKDSVLIASTLTGRKASEDRSALNFSASDVDELSMVIGRLDRKSLNLVLHGAGGNIRAAAEVMDLLRGRFDVIRALVPKCALSAVALVACACDVILMPSAAVIGTADDDSHGPVSADTARTWLLHNCACHDRLARADAAALVFASTDEPRVPTSACMAREAGLQINIVPEQSAVGSNLDAIWQGIEHTVREESLVKLMVCQKGPFHVVEG